MEKTDTSARDIDAAGAARGTAVAITAANGFPTYPLTLYFDDSCPLCRAEMAAITRCDPAGRIRLVDCSASGFDDPDCRAAAIATADLMRRLHARDAEGRWRVGVPAVAAAYAAVGLASLGGFLATPPLQPVLARLYGWLADHRQALSRLGLTGLFGRYVDWLARRAARRATSCHAGACDLSRH
jgi:predicted DCC family thiol-disulfide oxidoreductase YuxK